MHLSSAAHRGSLILLILFSFGMSGFISRTVFERLPHLEDELAYLYQARILARGQLVIDSPEPPIAFWQPFVLDRDGQRFGKYPLGWPLQLAVGEILGASWIINAWLSALAVALVYRLGMLLFDARTGLIAAALTSFSPMLLLLNGTLMGHTSALMFTLLTLWAYFHVERSRRPTLWAIAAGIGLGMIIINRPLTGLAVGLPLIALSAGRMLSAVASIRALFWQRMRPLLVMALTVLIVSSVIPIFNQAAVGDPLANLYTLVWPYDRIGFGECCGRNGHTLEKAFTHARYDLSLTAADLFGWQIGEFTPEVVSHLTAEADYFPNLGLSWLLIVPGIVIGLRRHVRSLVVWLLVAALWLALPLAMGSAFSSSGAAWVWVGGAVLWSLCPLLWASFLNYDRRTRWTWALIGLALSLILIQMTYWIGSQRYSTRYYFEALGALALLSAVPLSALSRRIPSPAAYGGMCVLLLASLFLYSLPRVGVLHGFNNVRQSWVEQALEQRQGNQDLLIIVTGTNLSWRAVGSFMAVTSPYLDSEIIAVFNRVPEPDDPGLRDAIAAQFPDRQVIELRGDGANVSFVDP